MKNPAWRKVTKQERKANFRQALYGMGFASYREYLASAHWADVRRRFWASKLPKHCSGCQSTVGLVLHHRTYKRIGTERLTDLILVCRDCHRDIHKFETENRTGLWGTTNVVLRGKRKEARARG